MPGGLEMEKEMSNDASTKETYGTNLLMGVLIAGSILLMVAFMAGLAPQTFGTPAVAAAPAQTVQEVVVVKAPHTGKLS